MGQPLGTHEVWWQWWHGMVFLELSARVKLFTLNPTLSAVVPRLFPAAEERLEWWD